MWVIYTAWNLSMTKISIDYNHVWHHHPLTVTLFVDDQQLCIDDSGTNQQLETNIDLQDGLHKCKFTITGKDNSNVLQEGGVTVKDSYILLNKITLDDINIDQILHKEAKFYPDHPDAKAPMLENITELGYNGEYIFTFSTPINVWLIEKLF